MKRYINLILPALIFVFGGCDDELKEKVGLEVSVSQNEHVKDVGDTIVVKKGAPLSFMMNGNPDFITFFSGEPGKKYEYRQRDQVDPAEIASSKLKFSIWYQYGSSVTAANLMDLYISDQFPGLAKNDFAKDSVLVEQAQWSTLVKPEELPTAPGNAAGALSYEIDMTPYLGKRFALAANYHGRNNTAAQSRVNFVGMRIENTMKDGTSSVLYASGFGFTPVNMMCHHNLDDQRNMTANREYGTVTNNISGIWNLSSAGSGNFFIHSSNAGKELKNSWLVSDLILSNAASPDAGIAIKNITSRLDTYQYTYEKVGVYKATFVATNSNYKGESTLTRELIIKVTD